jgi:hypothetical protein
MVPSCQFWVCCNILYTTEQKLSDVHILHPSHLKFYKRVHTKIITAGVTFVAPENLSLFLKPCSEQVPKN